MLGLGLVLWNRNREIFDCAEEDYCEECLWVFMTHNCVSFDSCALSLQDPFLLISIE